jgi:hypothetical protein
MTAPTGRWIGNGTLLWVRDGAPLTSRDGLPDGVHPEQVRIIPPGHPLARLCCPCGEQTVCTCRSAGGTA